METFGTPCLCHQEFSIRPGGENELTEHAATEMHKKATQAEGAINMTTFFIADA